MFKFLILPDLRTTSLFYSFLLFLNIFEVVDGLLKSVVTSLPVFDLS